MENNNIENNELKEEKKVNKEEIEERKEVKEELESKEIENIEINIIKKRFIIIFVRLMLIKFKWEFLFK